MVDLASKVEKALASPDVEVSANDSEVMTLLVEILTKALLNINITYRPQFT